MTVQDLINELQQIEDKTQIVKVIDPHTGGWQRVFLVEEFNGTVEIS